jgi:hypothetical protein
MRVLDVLLAMPRAEARSELTHLMSTPSREVWARACAARAQARVVGYASGSEYVYQANCAARCAVYSFKSPGYASGAARHAYNSANSDSARRAEHVDALRHALELLRAPTPCGMQEDEPEPSIAPEDVRPTFPLDNGCANDPCEPCRAGHTSENYRTYVANRYMYRSRMRSDYGH